MNENTYNSPRTDSQKVSSLLSRKRSGYTVTVLSLLLVDHLDLSPLYSESIKVLHLLTGISVRVFSTLARSHS